MADREKTMQGLEYCLGAGAACPVACPFYQKCDGKAGPYKPLLRDALEMLASEGKARLLTEADWKDNPNVDDQGFLPAWVEWSEAERRESKARFAITPHDGWTEINIDHLRRRPDKRRYWTGKPTEEQRKAVPWNG